MDSFSVPSQCRRRERNAEGKSYVIEMAVTRQVGACQQCHSRIFPCNIGLCCPCLPSSWRSAKELTDHVILGVLSTVGFIIVQIVEIATQQHCFRKSHSVKFLLVPMWLQDNVVNVTTFQEHKQRAEDEGKLHQLPALFQRFPSSMILQLCCCNKERDSGHFAAVGIFYQHGQDVAAKLTESATDFAFRSFDTSREGFEKFILDLKLYYSELYVQEDMLEESGKSICWSSMCGTFHLDLLGPQVQAKMTLMFARMDVFNL
eukprot:s2584_g10.t1